MEELKELLKIGLEELDIKDINELQTAIEEK